MEDLKAWLSRAERALASFQELSGLTNPSVLERDAAIKRFEYSFDIVWKTARFWLLQIGGVDQRTPKGVIRAARVANLLTDEQTVAALAMANDRNLTVHTYDEALARDVFARLDKHADLLQVWLAAMSSHVPDE